MNRTRCFLEPGVWSEASEDLITKFMFVAPWVGSGETKETNVPKLKIKFCAEGSA